MRMLLKYYKTRSYLKKFPLEIQLMLKYASVSKIRRYFRHRLFYRYGCDISHAAQLDSSVIFPHPLGIIIGSKVVVEDSCVIYQQVTLGSTSSSVGMPHVKKNVTIYAGAKLVGDIVVGENSIIGANAVVTKSVPKDSVVVGANIIKNRS